MEGMTIGQVSRQTGVGIETLRFYERESLIPAPPRNRSGYRMYQPEAVARIAFIRHAKALGFSLADIRELLFLRVDAAASCLEIKEIALARIADIEVRLSALTRMREALQDLAGTCRAGRSAGECQLLDSLLAGNFVDAESLSLDRIEEQ